MVKQKIRKETKLKDFYIEGTKAIHLKIVEVSYHYSYKYDEKRNITSDFDGKDVLERNEKTIIINLTPTTKNEIKKHRESDVPSLILKRGNKVYYAALPIDDIVFTSAKNVQYKHLCTKCSTVEQRCEGIENCSNIRYALETFNTKKHNTFLVFDCTNFKF